MRPYESIQQAEAALGRELTLAETLWFNYALNKSDFVLHLHILLSTWISYTVFPLPYVFIELFWSKKANQYKLQRDRFNSISDMFRCYKDAIKTLGLVVGPLEISSYPLCVRSSGVRTTLPLPSMWEIVCQISVYALIEDYLGYWLHRLLHSKWFYDKIHRVHHEYSSPMAFAGWYAHWAEFLILGIPTCLGPVLVPCHTATLWLWFLSRLWINIEIHSGYDFPWSVTKNIPFYGGVEHHDFHHRVGENSKTNFSPIFTYCDYIYGTDKGFRYHKSVLKKCREASMEKQN